MVKQLVEKLLELPEEALQMVILQLAEGKWIDLSDLEESAEAEAEAQDTEWETTPKEGEMADEERRQEALQNAFL